MKIMSDDNGKEEMKLKMNCAYGKRNDNFFNDMNHCVEDESAFSL